jgi:hypothetical protein
LFCISLKRDGGIGHVRQFETRQFIVVRSEISDLIRHQNIHFCNIKFSQVCVARAQLLVIYIELVTCACWNIGYTSNCTRSWHYTYIEFNCIGVLVHGFTTTVYVLQLKEWKKLTEAIFSRSFRGSNYELDAEICSVSMKKTFHI